ncbi:MAG: hypothetical protein AAF531_11750 [Actinomycetota bacterium]
MTKVDPPRLEMCFPHTVSYMPTGRNSATPSTTACRTGRLVTRSVNLVVVDVRDTSTMFETNISGSSRRARTAKTMNAVLSENAATSAAPTRGPITSPLVSPMAM